MIKPADKWSAIAAWSKKDYLIKFLGQLNDTTDYQECQSAFFQKVNKKTVDILRDTMNHIGINKKITDYLLRESHS